jgi:hypothetical protein
MIDRCQGHPIPLPSSATLVAVGRPFHVNEPAPHDHSLPYLSIVCCHCKTLTGQSYRLKADTTTCSAILDGK